MTSETTLQEMLSYSPVPSGFGTSGVRALVKDLTDLEVYCLTLGTLRYLKDIDKLWSTEPGQVRPKIPLGGDLRPSTDRLLRATARAILDAGYEFDYVGRIPTPALTFYALEQGVASFMVTGSHIPADRNGQKANRCDGEVLKSDEPGITAAVEAVRQAEYSRPASQSQFDSDGMLKLDKQPDLPAVNTRAGQHYLERYRQTFPKGGLHGMRIVFFEYAAVGRDLIPEILGHTGAEIICLGRSDEFVPIDTEAISRAHLEMFREIVADASAKHGPIDAVVSTDGDSDRPLLIGVEAQAGDLESKARLRFFPGDLLGTLVADYLRADAVAIPISANPAVHEHFATKGITTQKTRIGSPFVIHALQEAIQQGKQRAVAWEANGGFLVGSDMDVNDGELRALPTRDAVLPILGALYGAAERGTSLSQLVDRLPKWYGKADLIDNFPQETSQKILAYFQPPGEGVQWMEFEQDKIVLRDIDEKYLDHWPLETPAAREALTRKRELEAVFAPSKSFGEIVRINTQDGVRCFLDNDEIVHIRPSGNAPQLRIYANARTQARADAIVEMGVAEPDGLLRQLERFIASKS